MNNKKYPFTQNREISWLKFNQRVLEEAADPNVELFERLKFTAIFSSNLDEFFMVRAGSLMDMSLVDNSQVDSKSGMSPSEQLDAIYEESARLYTMRDNVYKNLVKTLKEVQIGPTAIKNLNKKEQKQVARFFETQAAPLLAPQIMDIHHPFPFLANKELYIFFKLIENGKTRFGIVPVPSYLPRVFYLNDEKTHWVMTEDIILHYLETLFGKAKIPYKTIIRVTRNADINLNAADIEDDEDYRQYMKKILKRRSRLSPIRLEIFKNPDPEALNWLRSQLKLAPAQVFVSRKAPLDLSYLFSIPESVPADLRSALSYQPFVPQTTRQLDPAAPKIPQILDHDVLLSYPYQDIDLFIELLKEASLNPDVVSISITIYRLAKNSQIVKYLCRAAENGKNVNVLMELRARFDEQNNIQAAEQLEDAGCTVFYGFDDYKVHSKLMQIVMKGKNGFQTITQIGTGNYNEKTSRQYTDFSLITSNPQIGHDAFEFFRNMNIGNLSGTYDKISASPKALKQMVIDNLDHQIVLAREGKPAKADFKMNSLTDLDLIAKLAEASSAGVKIRMIIRGICCLLPGIEGASENIEIHSIVGRYLEHGRIYIFGEGPDRKVYISSADFMTRNTERRVEVAAPVENFELQDMLQKYFDTQFKDDVKGRKLLSSGLYTQVESSQDEPLDSQQAFMKLAEETKFVSKPEEPKKEGWLARVRRSLKRTA